MSMVYQLNFRGYKASWRTFVKEAKKQVRRRARRLGKTLMEDAPKRATKGWAD